MKIEVSKSELSLLIGALELARKRMIDAANEAKVGSQQYFEQSDRYIKLQNKLQLKETNQKKEIKNANFLTLPKLQRDSKMP